MNIKVYISANTFLLTNENKRQEDKKTSNNTSTSLTSICTRTYYYLPSYI